MKIGSFCNNWLYNLLLIIYVYYKLFTFQSVYLEILTPWSSQVHPEAQSKGVQARYSSSIDFILQWHSLSLWGILKKSSISIHDNFFPLIFFLLVWSIYNGKFHANIFNISLTWNKLLTTFNPCNFIVRYLCNLVAQSLLMSLKNKTRNVKHGRLPNVLMDQQTNYKLIN
jgi:hypothetical protein